MALPTFVADSAPAAATATAVCTYPAGIAAGDLLVMMVSSDVSAIGTPAGFSQVGTTTTGGGTSVAIFKRTASGAETGSVTSTITGGTKGAAVMAAYRPPAGGYSLAIPASTGAIDNDTTTTAISMAGTGPITTVTDDLLAFFALAAASGGTFTGTATGTALTMPGSTIGTVTSRAAARTGTDTLYYTHRDGPVTSGGAGTPTYSAVAAGANASGSAVIFAVRTIPALTAPTSSANVPSSAQADSTFTVTDTSTATASGATITGRTWRIVSGGGSLSGTTASSVTVTAPGAAGSQVIGVTAVDSNGTTGTEATYTVSITSGPAANAGANQMAVEALQTVQLAGSGTGSPTVYSWRQSGGQAVTLSSTSAASPTFKAPASVDGLDLTFALSVGTTGNPLSAEDEVTIHILPHIEWHYSAGSWRPMAISRIY